jgi:predicted nucleotidyltransferase
MGSSLNYMSKEERYAIERFGKSIRSRLGESVVRMSVFGSKVRGDDKETSDIDILVIVKKRSLRVMDEIARN